MTRTAVLRLATLLSALALAGCGPTQSGEAGTAERSGADAPEQTAVNRPATTSDARRPRPDHAWVIFGADTVVAEVARTADQRAEGLMYREQVPDGTGMLFVFPDVGIRSFWMNNTYVPLDIAYLDADMAVVDIQQMEPRTTDPHESAAPAMFALEVRQGWFAERGVRLGTVARIEFGAVLGGG